MIKTNRKNDDIYPDQVKGDLANGWLVITENINYVLLGKGYERKCWDYASGRYISFLRGTTFVRKEEGGLDNVKKKQRW